MTDGTCNGCELWLVRHGQTDWNIQGLYQGQSDIPLNATGRQQAEELAVQLRGEPFAALYASDLSRAQDTARALSRAVALPVQLDRRLREINQGEWEGQNYRKIIAQFEEPQEQRDPATFRAPGGETVAEVAGRVTAAIHEIVQRHPGGRVLLVSHGVTLATVICLANGLPLTAIYQHLPRHTRPEVIYWPPAETAVA